MPSGLSIRARGWRQRSSGIALAQKFLPRMLLARRNCLKASLVTAGRLLMPCGVMAIVGCQSQPDVSDQTGFGGSIMGTGYTVRLGERDSAVSVDGLAQQVKTALAGVDVLMSTWRVDSEISLFNNRRDSDWVPMAPSTIDVMAHASTIAEQSAGAFDVTVGPLIDLWGFGAGSGSPVGAVPPARQIGKRLASVGYEYIEVDVGSGNVRKLNPLVQVDLSGIAKGYAVDRACRALDAAGVASYLVEVGGELRSRGRKSDKDAWRVGIERPASLQAREAMRVVNLQDAAIATSGDYRHFFMEGGQRYSHSIDPRTGKPVTHELVSVSVIAGTSMVADALSTTMMILGPDDAMHFADKHDVAAHLVLKSGDALTEIYSKEFEQLVL